MPSAQASGFLVSSVSGSSRKRTKGEYQKASPWQGVGGSVPVVGPNYPAQHPSLQETSGFPSEAAGSCGQEDRRVGERGGGPGFRETDPDVDFSAMSIKAMEGKTFFTIKEE